MLISQYYQNYTDHKFFTLWDVWQEVIECLQEIVLLRWKNVPDEWSDISIFIELWLYTKFHYNHELWKSSNLNLKKVQSRKPIWDRIYKHAKVKTTSNYCGNYSKVEKVVVHLGQLGVSEEKAREAYRVVVQKYKRELK